jgi:predicted acylesterase/phospholipase RssA
MSQRRKNSAFNPKLVGYITPFSSVSEGAKVQLDGSQSYYILNGHSPENSQGSTLTGQIATTRVIKEKEDGISYFWKQIDGPKVSLNNENTEKPTFVAPYINNTDSQNIGNSNSSTEPRIYTILKFQLVVKDKEGLSSEPVYQQVIVKIVQRALVLQGGGALGAYEVGVVKNLVESIINRNKKSRLIDNNKINNDNNNDHRPIFDIVAGASIGAVNAAIMVGNVIKLQKENRTLKQSEIWSRAVDEVERFWSEVSDPLTMVPNWMRNTESFQILENNWNTLSKLNNSLFDAWWHLIRHTREVWNNYYQQISKGIATTKTNFNKAAITRQSRYIWGLDKDEERGGENSGDNYPYYNYYIPIFTEEWPYIKWLSSEENWKEETPYIQNYFYFPENYGPIATVEGLRRYHSVAASMMSGVPKVLTPPIYQPDLKFFGPTFTRMDNAPLARTIKKYWDYDKYPIKTSFEDRQPRLFLISTDALDATSPVAFDSYVKENGICKTEYGDDEYEHVIEYQDGIRMEHVMASMSVHLKYKYPEMKAKSSEGGEEETQKIDDVRYMWDGAYLSNTPLREVLYGHRNYWRDLKHIEVKLEDGTTEIIVPDIGVYIINLYPSIEKELPMDADTIQDREIDIKFHDRTKYDLRLAQIATDYIELVEQLESLALKHSEQDEEFKRDYSALLDKHTRSKTRVGMKIRTYRDLVKGRFDITEAVHIERSDDGNTIFGKASEFSSKTVNELKEAGYQDAETAMEIEYTKEIIRTLADKEIIRNKNEILSMEQRLQRARIHAKHQNIDRAIKELDSLMEYTKKVITKAEAAKETRNESQLKKQEEVIVVEGKGQDVQGRWREEADDDNNNINIIFEFIKSLSKLGIQLLINKITIAINKDLITERRGEELKQKLQEIKTSLNESSSLSANIADKEQLHHNLHEFIEELNSLNGQNKQRL